MTNPSPFTTEGLHVDAPHTMTTYSGERVDPFDPDPDTINLPDIANALARICRFGGHVLDPVGHSVAAHSIRVAEHLYDLTGSPNIALQGLLHDATEAYLGDIVRPLKQRPEFAWFPAVEDRLAEMIFAGFGLTWPMNAMVHEADNAVLLIELGWRDQVVAPRLNVMQMAARFEGFARRFERERRTI